MDNKTRKKAIGLKNISEKKHPKREACPNCGHCPTCGRSSGWYPAPYYPWYPYPYTISGGSATYTGPTITYLNNDTAPATTATISYQVSS